MSAPNIQNLSNCCSQKGDEEAARAAMQKLRGEQTNIEEELLELQEGIEATANKVKKRLIGNENDKMVLNFLL